MDAITSTLLTPSLNLQVYDSRMVVITSTLSTPLAEFAAPMGQNRQPSKSAHGMFLSQIAGLTGRGCARGLCARCAHVVRNIWPGWPQKLGPAGLRGPGLRMVNFVNPCRSVRKFMTRECLP